MILLNTQTDGVAVYESRDAIPAGLQVETLGVSYNYGFESDYHDEPADAKQKLLADIAACTGCNAIIIQSSGFEMISHSATGFVIRAALLHVKPAE